MQKWRNIYKKKKNDVTVNIALLNLYVPVTICFNVKSTTTFITHVQN